MNYEVVRNDVGFDLPFTMKSKRTKARIDLTGYSAVLFKMWLPNSATNKINGACTVTDADEGECKYTVLAGDMDTAGVYNGEIEVTYTSGKIITGRGFTIEVKKDAPAV